MDVDEAVTRALIACRIYLALFDAGDGRAATVVFDQVGRGPGGAPVDHAFVADVVRRLREAHAIHGPMSDRPLDYLLLPDPRSRMAKPMGAMKPLVDQMRQDIALLDDGRAVPSGNWLDYDVRVRKGQLRREPL